MRHQEDIQKVELFIDVRPTDQFSSGHGILDPATRSLHSIPQTDFYINVNLNQTFEVYGYVDTQIDKTIKKIPRQEINPFYLEYAFFDGIIRNKINNGEDLNFAQLNYIRSARFDVSFFPDQDLREWFDAKGKNELPWESVLGVTTNIYDIEKAQINLTNILSKAEVLKIAISR
jgi:hypothetical protein